MDSARDSELAYPNVCERWTNGILTIPAKELGNERYHSHEHSHEAVLKDSKPDDLNPYELPPIIQHALATHIEPCQSTSGGPQSSPLAPTAFFHPT